IVTFMMTAEAEAGTVPPVTTRSFGVAAVSGPAHPPVDVRESSTRVGTTGWKVEPDHGTTAPVVAGGLEPSAFRATTENVYDVPGMSPPTVQEVSAGAPLQVAPPGAAMTR